MTTSTGKVPLDSGDWRRVAHLLFDLGTTIRDQIQRNRGEDPDHSASTIHKVTSADTIYQIDRVSEEALVGWFDSFWPSDYPAIVIGEGLDDEKGTVFPRNSPRPLIKILIDPIDGTRGLMYDKRSAWMLAGAAPIGDSEPTLADLKAGVMVEIPTSRQVSSDGAYAWEIGNDGFVVETVRFPRPGASPSPIKLTPSRATDLSHGFATFASYFPEGRKQIQAIEEAFLRRHLPEYPSATPLVFSDQYISSGGQIFELLAGRDRFVADLRPLVFEKHGPVNGLTCHPYDLACLPVATASDCVIEDPWGNPIEAPLDTTSQVAWVGYANKALAEELRPALVAALQEVL
ncbi:MAG: inositol monophosphatase [Verrucomicrobiota bacterium]